MENKIKIKSVELPDYIKYAIQDEPIKALKALINRIGLYNPDLT